MPADATGSWTQFQVDAANTGYQPDEHVSKSLVCPAWEFRGEGRFPSPLVGEDVVVNPGSRKEQGLLGLDRQHGQVRWRTDETIDEELIPTGSEGVVVGETLYTVLYDGSDTYQEQVVAIDITTGTKRWRTQFESTDTNDRLKPGITVTNGLIYVKSITTLYALSVTDGSTVWTAATEWGEFHSVPPAVEADLVVVSIDEAEPGFTGGGAVAFDAHTGEQRWTADVGRVQAAPTIVGDTVFLVRPDGPNSLCAIDRDSGSILWEFETLNGTHGSAAVANGVVYFGDSQGTLYAVNATDGSSTWTHSVGSRISQASPVVVSDTILIGAMDTSGPPGLHAIDSATGEPHWAFETTYSLRAAPAVAGGVIYVTTTMGSLYALV